MINKRLLIKNLLAHNDENSFYDKKRKIDISEKEGKAKFLKHICALSNSNPNNNSFIVIGVEDEDNTIAHDVCVCNILLNHYSKKLEADFDNNGDFAREGEIIYPLLENLNRLDFYHSNSPKSLGIEWVKENIFPFTEMYKDEPKNILTTAVFHIAKQIAETINGNEKPEKVLVTGGGAFNSFLIETLKTMTHYEIIIPEAQIINHKEALVFAFLGLLRWENKINCLSSVTGAKKDNIGGAIYYNK